MTATEMKNLVNAYGAENLLTIVYDYGALVHFDNEHIFDVNSIKTVNGVDVVEHNFMTLNSDVPGNSKIPIVSVHPTDTVQSLIFSPRERRSEVPGGDLNPS